MTYVKLFERGYRRDFGNKENDVSPPPPPHECLVFLSTSWTQTRVRFRSLIRIWEHDVYTCQERVRVFLESAALLQTSYYSSTRLGLMISKII